MGMYDTLFIHADMLPVSDEEKIKIGDAIDWQTKDLECIMTEVYITDDGEVKISCWEYETVPKEERPHPEEDGILGLCGSVRRINEHLETLPYHGYINFYSDVKGEWYEFIAKFTDGKLVNIERILDKI